jgi:hypothetical protein
MNGLGVIKESNMKFWIAWAIDAIVLMIFMYFFFCGLIDKSISSFNMGLWGTILTLLVSLLGVSLWLRSTGQIKLAFILLLIIAVPALLAGLFFSIVLLMKPKWN